MVGTKLVTINVDLETRDRLADIAKANMRSMTSQLEWMVMQEWVRLFVSKEAKVVEIGESTAPVDGAATFPIVTVVSED